MRFALASVLACAASFAACANEELLQYDDYRPPNELPLGEPTVRTDDGGRADAAPPDGGGVLVVDDASAPPANTCETARPIGTLSGDSAGPTLSAEGTCSEWVSLRATEDSTGGAPMKLKLSVTPNDYELFVSFEPVRDEVTCTKVVASTGALTWGEGTVPNGGEDGRTVRLAIVKKGGCGSTKWKLVVEGNR